MDLISQGEVTQDIIESGCVSWEDLVRSVRNFRYGRNVNRQDFNLVWHERKGTCSSKHAFLFQIAKENQIPDVELILGIYLMTAENAPKISEILNDFKLKGIPEAHCYLKVKGEYLDATSVKSNYKSYSDQILFEKPISPSYVISDKIKEHRSFIEAWVVKNEIPYSAEELWSIRERCIEAMSN